jgi:RNA-splicing ligase RtcB
MKIDIQQIPPQVYRAKYGQAKVFIQLIDEPDKDKATIQQIYEFLNDPGFTNPIAIMPDCHKGNGAVIGFTMEMGDSVVPNVIGVDIGCGMLSLNMGPDFLKNISRSNLDDIIRTKIPFGTSVNDKSFKNINDQVKKEMSYLVNLLSYNFHKRYCGAETHYKVPEITDRWLENKCDEIGMDYGRMLKSVGTLGGGNHFVEVGIDESRDYWITFHSGSRQFGQKIAVYHQRIARSKNADGHSSGLEPLFGEDMFNYLVDMVVAQYYAEHNRNVMAAVVMTELGKDQKQRVHSVHNFIDFNDWIMRKGAIRSYKNELSVIPFNMEDGLLICEGKSNAEWNCSAPHGAGRMGSRKWAKAALSLDDAKQSMADRDIYTSRIPADEIKAAYKPASIIEDNIEPTAKIVLRVKPVLNCKE